MKREQPTTSRRGRNRTQGRGTVARASAINRLKEKQSGIRSVAQIKIEEPIYVTVDEDHYKALVDKRKDNGFIVDDEGLGYADDGQEEDWVRPDEDDNIKPKKTKNPLHPASMKACSRKKNLSCDILVEDVLDEYAYDESDRDEHRRRRRKACLLGGGDSIIKKKKKKEDYFPHMELVKDEIPLVQTGSVVPWDKDAVCEPTKENKTSTTSRDIIEDNLTKSVVDVENVMMKKKSFVPDEEEARVVTEEKDSLLQADRNGAVLCRPGFVVDSDGSLPLDLLDSDGSLPLDLLDSDGSLPFYLLDAYEQSSGGNKGNLYLFGKVKAGIAYHSCCVVVKNMDRCVYAIPKGRIFKDAEITKLEEDAKESRISVATFRTKLQDIAWELKTEIANHLLHCNVSDYIMTPVKRNYAFERSDIPSGEHYSLKIKYSFKDPPLPSDLKGETFSAVLGTHSSALELFLVKRKIKGPSWLSVSRFSHCLSKRVSWCKFEVAVECPKDVQISVSSKSIAEVPPLVVTAINVTTITSEKHKTNEIVCASLVSCHDAKIDAPSLESEWTRPGMISHLAVVRKPDGENLPKGFAEKIKDRRTKAGKKCYQSRKQAERDLLSCLITEVHKLDSDVLVGHNVSRFDLDVILHRAQTCVLSSNIWSTIGRLKHSTMPELSKSSQISCSGASPGIMSCMAGRLLCDTLLHSQDLLRGEVDHSLTHLTKTHLNKDRKEVAPNDVPSMFQTSEKLLELIECCETDAWLSMELMFHMNILPITRQLTNISGNLWGKTLQGARAQRVEYLLLHAFHSKKFIVPDKCKDNTSFEDTAPQGGIGKAKKGPAYSGGLVLEPKKGLYDNYILLLDFNSLYPSIIQEYNICFTTVEMSHDGTCVLPISKKAGVLPQLLKNLVERRKQVKTWLKSESGLRAKQLHIQQYALKLTANSMYGCLGSSNFRFYAKPLAEMITSQGRGVLQSTVDLIQNELKVEVIYGDTDSIMINTGLDDIGKAKSIAGDAIKTVNKKYNCLEIDLDGLYKRMLLLKKKKYAAVRVQFKDDGTSYEVTECKGLEMVRRDWSPLCKEVGYSCLRLILSGGSCDDVVESIHCDLMKVKEEIKSGLVPLEKYVITKKLAKPPEEYPDGKNQPHVVVALRLKMSGYSTGCFAGDSVPYVICCEQESSSSNNNGLAQRAMHPNELKPDNGKWKVDIDYYLSCQIYPVVSRLCAFIQGTSPARLADYLGLDSPEFQPKSIEVGNNDPSTLFLCGVDDKERYAGCSPLVLSCPRCSNTFDCLSISSSVLALIKDNRIDTVAADETFKKFWFKLQCPRCPEKISPATIANQVKRQVDMFINTYYEGHMTCDDETCKYTTRSLSLRVLGDSGRGTICPNYPRCNGHLIRKYTEADLYQQLSYFCHVLDTVCCLDKVEQKIKLRVEKELRKLRPVVEPAALTAHKMRDQCAFGWVQLQDLF